MSDLVEFLRARLNARRMVRVAIEMTFVLLTIAFGFFALMFVGSGMAGPAAAYAFCAGVLAARLAARVWRWTR